MSSSATPHTASDFSAPPLEQLTLTVAQSVACTEAEGPGKRFALWVQGCPFRCPGCCNPEMLEFAGGTPRTVDGVIGRLLEARQQFSIEGLTLLGGEPFAHAAPLNILARAAQDAGLSVMIFTGYTLMELRAKSSPDVHSLLAATDLLVDGRFDQTQPDTTRRWVGSCNQEIHFLTNRYRADDEYWSTGNTIELRWDGKSLLVNGFPADSARTVWERIPLQAENGQP